LYKLADVDLDVDLDERMGASVATSRQFVKENFVAATPRWSSLLVAGRHYSSLVVATDHWSILKSDRSVASTG
jgi:hypothetical protein